MKEFWEQRYSEPAYAYGEHPNAFLKEFLVGGTPGQLLLPADGEGRNSVFAAQLGWEVEAFDYSSAAQKKALTLGEKLGVHFSFHIGDYQTYIPKSAPFDVIALTFTHSAPDIRSVFHKKLLQWLKPGGSVVLEGFSKAQLGKSSGGPKALDMLWSAQELKADFHDLEIAYLEEIETVLDEGPYHQGEASVVRMVGYKS